MYMELCMELLETWNGVVCSLRRIVNSRFSVRTIRTNRTDGKVFPGVHAGCAAWCNYLDQITWWKGSHKTKIYSLRMVNNFVHPYACDSIGHVCGGGPSMGRLGHHIDIMGCHLVQMHTAWGLASSLTLQVYVHHAFFSLKQSKTKYTIKWLNWMTLFKIYILTIYNRTHHCIDYW
jgi:hypothetical protein